MQHIVQKRYFRGEIATTISIRLLILSLCHYPASIPRPACPLRSLDSWTRLWPSDFCHWYYLSATVYQNRKVSSAPIHPTSQIRLCDIPAFRIIHSFLLLHATQIALHNGLALSYNTQLSQHISSGEFWVDHSSGGSECSAIHTIVIEREASALRSMPELAVIRVDTLSRSLRRGLWIDLPTSRASKRTHVILIVDVEVHCSRFKFWDRRGSTDDKPQLPSAELRSPHHDAPAPPRFDDCHTQHLSRTELTSYQGVRLAGNSRGYWTVYRFFKMPM